MFFRDTLPRKPYKAEEIGILNLDLFQNPGTHWTLWYKKNENKYYFDSFGIRPCSELCKYLGGNIESSTFVIQKLGTNYCGHLCIMVIDLILQGFSFKEAVFKIWQKFSQIKDGI